MEFLKRAKELRNEISELKEYCKILSKKEDSLEGLYKALSTQRYNKHLRELLIGLFLDIKNYIDNKDIIDAEEYKQLNKIREALKDLEYTFNKCEDELAEIKQRFENEYLLSLRYDTIDKKVKEIIEEAD